MQTGAKHSGLFQFEFDWFYARHQGQVCLHHAVTHQILPSACAAMRCHRYQDAEAEAAAEAAALGPVQRSQGADLAQLLAQAEPFDRGYYYRQVGAAWKCPAGSLQDHVPRPWLQQMRSSSIRLPIACSSPKLTILLLCGCRARVNLTQDVGLPPESAEGGYQVRVVQLLQSARCRSHALGWILQVLNGL